jgi:hypothetical protein
MTRSFRLSALCVLAPIAAAVAAAPARAQAPAAPRELPSAERMLQVFEEDAQAARTGGTEGIAAVQWAVTHPKLVAPAKLDSVLVGLERTALTSATRLARIRAAMQLGRMEDSAGIERLLRIYRASSAHPEVRSMLLSVIEKPRLPRQLDAYLALLRGIVVAPAGAEDFEDAPFEAMRRLYGLEAPGIAALRDLHTRGLARNPEVRALLASWARQNFHLQESAPGA